MTEIAELLTMTDEGTLAPGLSYAAATIQVKSFTERLEKIVALSVTEPPEESSTFYLQRDAAQVLVDLLTKEFDL